MQRESPLRAPPVSSWVIILEAEKVVGTMVGATIGSTTVLYHDDMEDPDDEGNVLAHEYKGSLPAFLVEGYSGSFIGKSLWGELDGHAWENMVAGYSRELHDCDPEPTLEQVKEQITFLGHASADRLNEIVDGLGDIHDDEEMASFKALKQ